MQKFNINSKLIGDDSSVFVIAEAGINHAGSFIEAKKWSRLPTQVWLMPLLFSI